MDKINGRKIWYAMDNKFNAQMQGKFGPPIMDHKNVVPRNKSLVVTMTISYSKIIVNAITQETSLSCTKLASIWTDFEHFLQIVSTLTK